MDVFPESSGLKHTPQIHFAIAMPRLDFWCWYFWWCYKQMDTDTSIFYKINRI